MTDIIEILDENEEIFETIAAEADDSEIAERFGRQPLKLLKLHRERNGDGAQSRKKEPQ